MNIIPASFQIEPELTDETGFDICHKIERAARTCYKSEGLITFESFHTFLPKLIKSGHESPLEHASLTVRFIVDRGVSHELVRHRLAAYCQESTRYCNYSKDKFGKEITVIEPLWSNTTNDKEEYALCRSDWLAAMAQCESSYFSMLSRGASPQEARSVLPNSLKTEIVMTANIREWRHVLKLRTSKAAHPQMREIMTPLLAKFKQHIRVLFDDIKSEE